MRLPFVGIFVLLAAATIVAAFVFRSQRARGMLNFLMKAAWAYIIAVFIIAAIRLWQMGVF